MGEGPAHITAHLAGGAVFKKAKDSIISKWIGMKFGAQVASIDDLGFLIVTSPFQDGSHDVISLKAYGSVISNWIRMKFGRRVLHINTQHRLMELDFQFDVTLSRWWP